METDPGFFTVTVWFTTWTGDNLLGYPPSWVRAKILRYAKRRLFCFLQSSNHFYNFCKSFLPQSNGTPIKASPYSFLDFFVYHFTHCSFIISSVHAYYKPLQIKKLIFSRLLHYTAKSTWRGTSLQLIVINIIIFCFYFSSLILF
jgi:hypothetical protein